MQADLSPQQEAWFERARVDFRFFCSFLKIRIKDERDDSKDGLVGPFIWRPAQEVVWAWMQMQMRKGIPIYLVILKARQFGISTFMCAWLFWQMWRATNVRTMVAVKQKGTSMNALIEAMDRFYQSLPEGFRPALRAKGAKRVSKEEIYFADRKSGGYFIAAETKDAARGDAFDHSFCTEVGAYTRAPEFFGEVAAAMGSRKNTSLLLESTAAPGYFRMRYLRAKPLDSAVFLPWSCAPELYSRELFLDYQGRRKVLRDKQTEEVIALTAADRKEMAFLSKEHERINATIGRDLLKPVTEGQMWWWHWFCETQMDGDEDYMRQEFPRDDTSAFERGSISAFKPCLPIVRQSVDDAKEECPDIGMGTLSAETDLADVEIEEQTIIFTEAIHVGSHFQERDPGIIIFEWPKREYVYTLGCDVADDIETAQDEEDANFSVISVFCCNTRSQAAEWRGSMDPHLLGDEVAKVGYLYNTALACVEYNNMGVTTIDRLTKYLNYPNRFKWPIFDEAGKVHKKKEMWWTDTKTKQLMIGSFRHAVMTGLYRVRSPGLYEEMMGYQNIGGLYKAGPDTFADRLIAAALSWQGVEQTDFGMAQVLGYLEEKKAGVAQGQAKRFIATSGNQRSPFDPVPRQLPSDFGELAEKHVIEDNWIFEAAKL